MFLGIVIITILLAIACYIIHSIKASINTFRNNGIEESLRESVRFVFFALITSYALAYIIDECLNDGVWGTVYGLLESLYAAILSLTMGAELRDTIGVFNRNIALFFEQGTFVTGLVSGLASVLYSIILTALCIAAPLLTIGAVITIVQKWLVRWRYLLARRGKPVAYLFSSLDEANASLAKDVLNKAREQDALVIICNMTNEARDFYKDEVEGLLGKGNDRIIFTPRSMPEVTLELETSPEPNNSILSRIACKAIIMASGTHRYTSIHCIMFDNDCTKNVRSTIDLMERVVDLAFKDKTCSAKESAQRYHIYCLHDDSENELIFDSLVHGTPDSDDGPQMLSDDEWVSQDIKKVLLSMDLHLVMRAREQAFQLYTRYPLYSILDTPVALGVSQGSRDDIEQRHDFESFMREEWERNEPQKLYVTVIGLGHYGIEALRTAYWIGRMRNVELHITGIDREGLRIQEELEFGCPEMMDERLSDGNAVVRIEACEVFSEALRDVYANYPADARTYTVITLGNDQLNLDAALHVRRILNTICVSPHPNTIADADPHHHLVLPLINSRELARAADQMVTDRAEEFSLEPFGRTKEIFSYRSIIDSPWDRYARAMCAAYLEVWDNNPQGSKGVDVTVEESVVREEYAKYEITKLSNRTNVRHIPYRLWSIGVDPAGVFNLDGSLCKNQLNPEAWRTILGLSNDLGGITELLQRHAPHVPDKTMTEENLASAASAVRKKQQELRDRFPIVCALSDLEHARWMAFYRSQGWRDLTPKNCQRLKELGIIPSSSLTEHQSPKLRLHSYLCDTENDILLERGLLFYDDPFAYDRASIIETVRVLNDLIILKKHDSSNQ